MFGPYEYVVQKIDGDYAKLKRTDCGSLSEEPVLVARALLPEDIQEGSRLRWENLQYTLLA